MRSDAVTAPCLRAVEAMHERYDITRLERKTPLVLESESLSGARYRQWKLKQKLQKGDAVIASRVRMCSLSAPASASGASGSQYLRALVAESAPHRGEKILQRRSRHPGSD